MLTSDTDFDGKKHVIFLFNSLRQVFFWEADTEHISCQLPGAGVVMSKTFIVEGCASGPQVPICAPPHCHLNDRTMTSFVDKMHFRTIAGLAVYLAVHVWIFINVYERFYITLFYTLKSKFISNWYTCMNIDIHVWI